MRVGGPTGDSLSLAIGGWEFPGIEDDQYDSNWLLIDVSATVRGRSWTTRDPCFLAWEVAALIVWLDSLAAGGQVEQELDFMEPNLSFHVHGRIGDRIRMRVFFELESRPNWAPADGAGMNDLWADIECTSDELRAWADDLRRQLSRFPRRGGAVDGQSKQ